MKTAERIWTTLIVGALALGILWTAAFAQKAGSAENNSACLSNAKQLALATLMYSQDYDEHFPPLKSYSKFQTVVMPYVRNNSIFGCPETGKRYMLNANLHQIVQSKIKSPAKTVLLYDAAAHADGT
jgi:hypothetical protein